MNCILIVNADDCNLTPGVTRAILECHDRGIVSSTTFMANLPVEEATVRALKKRKNLGVGIHLNITFAKPAARPARVKSLLGGNGNFRKPHDQISRPPKASHILEEYAAQIRRFKDFFGRMPTHLDTHHQIHDHPLFFNLLLETARRYRLPLRRSALMLQSKRYLSPKGNRYLLNSPDFIFGNLTVEGYWRAETLETVLRNLPEGVSEIMCHPGICDADLKSVSSLAAGREAERKLFRSSHLRRLLQNSGVILSHYGMPLCYTSRVWHFFPSPSLREREG